MAEPLRVHDDSWLAVLNTRGDRYRTAAAFLGHVDWLFKEVTTAISAKEGAKERGEHIPEDLDLPWLDIAVRLQEASALAREMALDGSAPRVR